MQRFPSFRLASIQSILPFLAVSQLVLDAGDDGLTWRASLGGVAVYRIGRSSDHEEEHEIASGIGDIRLR